MKDILIIVGSQRSGTTLLNKTLEKYGNIKTFGEIFHHMAGLDEDKGRFFAFKKKLLLKNNDLFMPTPENQEKIWEKYVSEHVFKKANDKVPLLDIKYNSWHHLDPIWKYVDTKPYLLSLIENNINYKLIHVVRKNIFLQACSQVRALNTGKYHSFQPGNTLEDKVYIDPKEVLRFMNIYKTYEKKFDVYLSTNKNVVKLYYEDISDVHLFNTEVRKRLEKISIVVDEIKSYPMKKVSPHPKEWIENYEELIECLLQNNYIEYV